MGVQCSGFQTNASIHDYEMMLKSFHIIVFTAVYGIQQTPGVIATIGIYLINQKS